MHFMPPHFVKSPCHAEETRQFREVDDEEANEEFAMTPNGGTIASCWRLPWTRFTEGPEHLGSLLSKVIHQQITAEMFMIRWR